MEENQSVETSEHRQTCYQGHPMVPTTPEVQPDPVQRKLYPWHCPKCMVLTVAWSEFEEDEEDGT